MNVIRCDQCNGERAKKGGWLRLSSDMVPGRDGEWFDVSTPASHGPVDLCSYECVVEWGRAKA